MPQRPENSGGPTTRRQFLTRAAGGVAGLTGAARALAAATDDRPAARATVAVIRDSRSLTEDMQPVADVVQRMVDEAVCAVTGREKRDEAWAALIKPEDVVGLKVNTLAGWAASTSVEVTDAVAAGCVGAGVKPENVIIWDRWDPDLIKGGYTINAGGPGVKCYGTMGSPSEIGARPGYGDPVQLGSTSQRYSKVLTDQITALINLPMLKTHQIAGITAALKNHMGSVSDPRVLHDAAGGPNVEFAAHLSAHPDIRTKTRLVLCDALWPLYNAGPMNAPQFRWHYGAVLAATDPMAHDLVCMDIIRTQRNAVRGPRWPILPPPRHVELARTLDLGVSDPAHIDRIERDLSA